MRSRRHSGGQQAVHQSSRDSEKLRWRLEVIRPWRTRAFLMALLLLATVLRTYNLAAQSLWADEGNSARVTERPLALVVAAARGDIHPPGYYVMLWGWVKLFGQSEYALRALSVVIGVALVGLVYLIGKSLAGERVGWYAAFVAALSPFQVQYSQEVRMYILVAFLGACAAYAFLRWQRSVDSGQRSPWGWSVLYVLAVAGGLWTHYSFPVVVVALNVAWLVWWVRSRGRAGRSRALVWWLAMQGAAVVLYAPWLATAWYKITGYGPISEAHSVPFIAGQALRLLSLGETAPDGDVTRWLTVGIVALAVFGAWEGVASSPGEPRSAGKLACVVGLVSLTVLPIAMASLLSVAGRSAYRAKFFLVSSPAFCVLVGLGISLLGRTAYGQEGGGLASRLWLVAGLGLVGVGAARSLRNYYFDPAYSRSDYRGIAAHIASVAREGDAILLNAPNQWEVFTYYHRDGAPVYPLCRTRPPVEEQVVSELEQIVARHDRLFALFWAVEESDPERIVERWLQRNAYKTSDQWYGEVRLAEYTVPQGAGAAEMQTPLDRVHFGTEIALRGFTLMPRTARPGDVLQLTLFWEALGTPQDRYKVFVHLVGPDGQIVSQNDSEPGGGMNPTTGWTSSRGVFSDRYGVVLPESLPTGQYRLLVGLYHIAGEPRLPVSVDGESTGDHIELALVDVKDSALRTP